MVQRRFDSFVARDETRFVPRSWPPLVLALALIGLSLAQTIYRTSLPSDGWSYQRDLSGTGLRLVLSRNLAEGPSPLAIGDELLAVEGQSVVALLARALTRAPQPPPNWAVGQPVHYTVRRDGRDMVVEVPVRRLTARQILGGFGQMWLTDPSSLPFALIAFFVYLRRPGSAPARLLLLLGASVFASNGISQAVADSNVLGPAELLDRGAYWPAILFNAWIWPLLIAPIYLHLFLRFPVVKSPLRTHRRLVLATLYGAMPVATLLALFLNLGRPLDFWRTWASLSSFDYFVAVLAAVGIAGHTLLTARDSVGRAQIQWIALGTLVTTLGALVGGLLGLLGLLGTNPLADILFHRVLLLAFPIALAIAILRYRLFEIDVVVNRTLVGTALAGSLALIYVASVLALQQLFQAALGEQSDVALVLSTLAIIVLFQPLRRRIQRLVDRRFYRHKYDTTRVLAEFGATVRDEVDLAELSEALLAVVEDTMQPRQAWLWLRPPSKLTSGPILREEMRW
jgi:hypothetical protein